MTAVTVHRTSLHTALVISQVTLFSFGLRRRRVQVRSCATHAHGSNIIINTYSNIHSSSLQPIKYVMSVSQLNILSIAPWAFGVVVFKFVVGLLTFTVPNNKHAHPPTKPRRHQHQACWDDVALGGGWACQYYSVHCDVCCCRWIMMTL